MCRCVNRANVRSPQRKRRRGLLCVNVRASLWFMPKSHEARPFKGSIICRKLASDASASLPRRPTSRTPVVCLWPCCRSGARWRARGRDVRCSWIIIVLARRVPPFRWQSWAARRTRAIATPSTPRVIRPTVGKRPCRAALMGRCCGTAPRGGPCGRQRGSLLPWTRPQACGGPGTVRAMMRGAAGPRVVG